jgi:hypothetical protein
MTTSDEPRTLRLEKLLTALSDEEVERFCRLPTGPAGAGHTDRAAGGSAQSGQ